MYVQKVEYYSVLKRKELSSYKKTWGDIHGDLVADLKNLPSNAGEAGLISGQGTKIPHATGQLSPRATTTKLVCLNERACMLQTTEPTRSGPHVPQLERENPHATTREQPRPP